MPRHARLLACFHGTRKPSLAPSTTIPARGSPAPPSPSATLELAAAAKEHISGLWCQSRWCLAVPYTNSHMPYITRSALAVSKDTNSRHKPDPQYIRGHGIGLTHPRLAACSRSEHSRPRPNRTPTLPLPLRLPLHPTNPCSDSRQEHQDSPKPTHTSTDPDPHTPSVSARAEPLATLRAPERHLVVSAPAASREQRHSAWPPSELFHSHTAQVVLLDGLL